MVVAVIPGREAIFRRLRLIAIHHIISDIEEHGDEHVYNLYDGNDAELFKGELQKTEDLLDGGPPITKLARRIRAAYRSPI